MKETLFRRPAVRSGIAAVVVLVVVVTWNKIACRVLGCCP